MESENGNGNGNGNIIIKFISPIIGLIALIAGISAIVAPIRQSIDGVQKEVDVALKWQQDYMRGQIPSSAEKDLAAIQKMFAEVETQFHAFKDQMNSNQELNTSRSMRNADEIKLLTDRQIIMREQIAVVQTEMKSLEKK